MPKQLRLHKIPAAGGNDGGKKKDKSFVSEAIELAKGLGAEVTVVSKHDLNMLSDNRPHQVCFFKPNALPAFVHRLTGCIGHGPQSCCTGW